MRTSITKTPTQSCIPHPVSAKIEVVPLPPPLLPLLLPYKVAELLRAQIAPVACVLVSVTFTSEVSQL